MATKKTGVKKAAVKKTKKAAATKASGKKTEKTGAAKTEKVLKSVPNQSVTLADGSRKKLSELVGKKGLVLYFYPKDSTPGCTRESCDFRDNLARLKKAGFAVLGVSPDSPESHQKFSEKQGLNFPLIADTEKKLAEALGVWAEKKLYGRTFMGILRTTFLLDASLKIIKIYEKVKVDGHVENILADLSSREK